MTQVVYNGATGGLGQHLQGALSDLAIPCHALEARLGDEHATAEELASIPIERGARVIFIQAAGLVPVSTCEADPSEAFDVNVTRTEATAQAVVRALQRRHASVGVLFISSGHVYAPPKPGERLDEEAPIGPRSVYAKTKIAGEEAAAGVSGDHGSDFSVARVFGMLGPGQRSSFLLPGLVDRARTGAWREIPGLDHIRDYLDTRDVANHVARLASHMAEGEGMASVVNVCSGEETSIREVMNLVLQAVGVDPGTVAMTPGPGRPTDVPWVVGDPRLLQLLTNRPARATPLHRTVAEAVAAH